VQLALAKAGMIEGKPVGEKGVAVAVAAEATLRRWSAEFSALQVTQRPTFVLTNDIGDRYVLSGNFRYEPLEACSRALLADADGYKRFASHNDPLPA